MRSRLPDSTSWSIRSSYGVTLKSYCCGQHSLHMIVSLLFSRWISGFFRQTKCNLGAGYPSPKVSGFEAQGGLFPAERLRICNQGAAYPSPKTSGFKVKRGLFKALKFLLLMLTDNAPLVLLILKCFVSFDLTKLTEFMYTISGELMDSSTYAGTVAIRASTF